MASTGVQQNDCRTAKQTKSNADAKSHADLNRVKFDVIHEFDQHLPTAMYNYEWTLAEEGKGKTYRAVTTLERWIPILFSALHVVLAIMTILTIVGFMDWTK